MAQIQRQTRPTGSAPWVLSLPPPLVGTLTTIQMPFAYSDWFKVALHVCLAVRVSSIYPCMYSVRFINHFPRDSRSTYILLTPKPPPPRRLLSISICFCPTRQQYGIAALQLLTTIGSTLFHLTRETKFFNLDNVFATSLLSTTVWGLYLAIRHGELGANEALQNDFVESEPVRWDQLSMGEALAINVRAEKPRITVRSPRKYMCR